MDGAEISPSAGDLLTAWELGLPGSTTQRSAAILGALLPGVDHDALLAMSLAERDARLLAGHAALFGPQLECVVRCPACGVELEVGLGVDELLAGADDPQAASAPLQVGSWHVEVRSVALRDLIDAAAAPDADSARRLVLARCATAHGPDGSAVEGGALPPDVEAAVLEELEHRHPIGTLDLALTCPECAHEWIAPFDASAFVWAEVDGWAHRTLREVHALATAYGWPESEILALSAHRRSAYLQLAGHG